MNGKLTDDDPTRAHSPTRHSLSNATDSSTALPKHLLTVSRKFIAVVLSAFRPAIYDYLWYKTPLKPLRLRETAYLDGLRGLACINVFLFHRSYLIKNANFGWGANGENWELHRLPIIRLSYAGGHFSVGLFFAISGYVISLKALSIMHSKSSSDSESANAVKDGKLIGVLQRSLIKRWFRLFIPSLACSLIVAIMFHTGFFTYMEPRLNLSAELGEWWRNAIRVSNVYGLTGQSQFELWERFNPNNWTVSVEFKCSLFLFLLLLSLSHIRNPMIRLFWIVGHIIVALFAGYWTIGSFYLGLLLAEFDTRPNTKIQQEAEITVEIELGNGPSARDNDDDEANLLSTNADQVHPYPSLSKHRPRYTSSSQVTSIGTQFAWWSLALSALFIASAPVMDQSYGETHKDPPAEPYPQALFYGPIYALTPTNLFFVIQDPESFRFITTLSSFLFLFSIKHIPLIQKWLQFRAIQRLGVISYSFYLVHNSIAYSVLQTVMRIPSLVVPSEKAEIMEGVAAESESLMGSVGSGIAVFTSLIGNLAGTIWVADVFERLIDAPAIRLAANIEKWLNQ